MNTNDDVPRFFFRPEECAVALAQGRTRVYAAMASGELRSVRIGRSRRVPADALAEYAERLAAS